MRLFLAALLTGVFGFGGDAAQAKDTCTHVWRKGSFKSHKQVEEELRAWLKDAKILRLSLCSSAAEHYFLVTILEAGGKVRVLRMKAR